MDPDVTTSNALSSGDVVAFIVIPIFFALLVYATLSMFVWPYARPLLPLWIILVAILVPPLFPLLLFYVLFMALLFTPVGTEPVYVVERPATARVVIVEHSPRSSPRSSSRSSPRSSPRSSSRPSPRESRV